MKKIAYFVVILCFMGCSDSDSLLENGILTGKFREITPESDRLTTDITTQSLTYLNKGVNPSHTFSIRLLSRNRLEMSCNECDETAPQIVSYKIIDGNTFEIGGFILETENQLLTFERIEEK